MKLRLLITGGNGYIGSNFVKFFGKKHDLYILDINKNKKKLKNVKKFYEFNIKNQNKFCKIVKQNKIDGIIHLAAKIDAHESIKKKKLYFKNNYEYSVKIFNSAKFLKVKYFIFASSAAIYGIKKKKFKETDTKLPINPYGAYKLKFENYMVKNKKNIKIAILRFFNVIGNYPTDRLKKNKLPIVPKIQSSLVYKKKLKIFGDNHNTEDGTAARDYIHVEDVVKIINKSLLLMKKNKKKLIINCGTGKITTILDLIKFFEKKYRTLINVEFLKKKQGDPSEVISINKHLIKDIGYKFKYKNINLILKNL
tara:strand:+ start:620 stop:1546 length:927 start_codon:yes stop_codon:yes gene_type:complete